MLLFAYLSSSPPPDVPAAKEPLAVLYGNMLRHAESTPMKPKKTWNAIAKEMLG